MLSPTRSTAPALLLLLAGCAAPAAAPPPPPEPIDQAEAAATFDAAWETIRDTHFDPTFNGVDWEAVREELRPLALDAETGAELREVLNEMLARLGQSHFALLPEEARPSGAGAEADDAADPGASEAGGPGFDVRVREGAALITHVQPASPAASAGIEPGWIVTRAGDFDVAAARDMEAFALRQAILVRANGPLGTRVSLELLDDEDEKRSLVLERAPRAVVAHDLGTTLPTFYLAFEDEILDRDGLRVGRIHFTNWFLPMMEPIDQAVDRMRSCDGIVLDLRGNTGGVGAMTMGVAGHFFEKRRELGVQTMRDGQIRYVAMPRLLNGAGARVRPFSGPVAILIDEITGSASEVFAGGMQSVGRARVFGETSAGAVLPAHTTILPNGDALLHAIGDFKTADGTHLEGRGVVPDTVVPLTRADLMAGRDRPLEAAIDWIRAASSENL